MLLLARQKSNKVKSEQPNALEFGWREIETHLLLQRRRKAGEGSLTTPLVKY